MGEYMIRKKRALKWKKKKKIHSSFELSSFFLYFPLRTVFSFLGLLYFTLTVSSVIVVLYVCTKNLDEKWGFVFLYLRSLGIGKCLVWRGLCSCGSVGVSKLCCSPQLPQLLRVSRSFFILISLTFFSLLSFSL